MLKYKQTTVFISALFLVDVVKEGVNHQNPSQTPVLACDQPLYALAKQIQ